LDAELAHQDSMDRFVWAIKSERAFFMANFQRAVPCRSWWLVGRAFWNRHESNCLDVFDAFLAMAKASDSSREAERKLGDSRLQNHRSWPASKSRRVEPTIKPQSEFGP